MKTNQDSNSDTKEFSKRPKPVTDFMFPVVYWWFAILLFWFCLLQPIHFTEILAGMLCALISSLLATAANSVGSFKLHPEGRWLKLAFSIPTRLFQDFWKAILALGRQILQKDPQYGEFRAVHFDDDLQGGFLADRRVLLTTMISLLPNTYVIGTDLDENMILIHEMVPSSDLKDLLL